MSRSDARRSMVVTRSQKLRSQGQHDHNAPGDRTKLLGRLDQEPAIVLLASSKTRLSESRPAVIPQPPGLHFELQPAVFGLIQERIRDSLYALLVQAILWNQTRGLAARPILFALLQQFPSPEQLACASHEALSALIQPIGLQNSRAQRLIALGQAWVSAPPCKERRYRRLHYPSRGAGRDVHAKEVLGPDDERQGWEVAHLPGLGPYALDSFRIFFRDRLRGVEAAKDVEPEWKRVVPEDKDLKAYLAWRWSREGRHK